MIQNNGREYVVIDINDNNNEFCSTKEEAIKIAEDMIDTYRDDAMDEGWPEDLEISIYHLVAQSKQINIIKREDMDKETQEWFPTQFDGQLDYEMSSLEDEENATKKD